MLEFRVRASIRVKIRDRLETPRYETTGYEKVRVRNVWKPIVGLLLPSCVGTGFMEDMDDVGWMKKWKTGHCNGSDWRQVVHAVP